MSSIFLSLDWNCYSYQKEIEDRMGGTERFFITLYRWLTEEGYMVDKGKFSNIKGYDLAIFSNVANDMVKAKKRICFCGSTHSDAATYPYDEVVNVSEYMRTISERGIVIYPPFTNDVLKYKDGMSVPYRIFCSANPSKYYGHLGEYIEKLSKKNDDWHFIYSGGNKLYSDQFPESFSPIYHEKLHYRGILSRKELLGLLSSAQVFVLPAFTSKAPTYEVSPLEAMAMGITTILPNVPPYNEVHKEAVLCNSVDEMVEATIKAFDTDRIRYNMEKFTEETAKKQWLDLIRRMTYET